MKIQSISHLPSILLLISLTVTSLRDAEAAPVPTTPLTLWPGGAPAEKGDLPEEGPLPARNNEKPIIRLANVSEPTLQVFRPKEAVDGGPAVVVCPGGGYNILAMDLEGTEVVEWLNRMGVTGILLKYRVPRRAGLEKHVAPLQDAQRALSLVRYHARDWNLDPMRIGILGFSAGGHLSACASTRFDQRAYEAVDAADRVSCRPDFAVLVYPAYLTVKERQDAIAPELTVSGQTPPTFIVQTQDDGVRVESGLFYYLALKQKNVPAELHLYPKGGHGYGLRPSANTVSTWPDRVQDWMKINGLLPTP